MNSVFSKGWKIIEPLGQDGSPRHYSRIENKGRTAILMDCSHGEIPGHNSHDFIRIAKWLNEIGLKAPEIYEEHTNYLIIEDFGDVTFKKAVRPDNINKLYELAANVLSHIQTYETFPILPDYYQSHVHKGRRRIIDWYAPLVRHQRNPEGLAEKYLQIWQEIEQSLPPCPQGFVYTDFHFENLMVLQQEQGLKSCGLLDFQGAMKGPLPYDLGNLLEDVRADVPKEIRDDILKKYDDDFLKWYRVLTTQFHCRVVGQFIKMAARDHKTGYLQYIPRTQKYIVQALQDPLLEPLKIFFEENKINFSEAPDLKNIKILVRPDAF